MSENLPSPPEAQPAKPLYETVDVITRARCGSLAAHGVTELQITEMLMLTIEQVLSVKESPEYKTKYAEVANESIEKQLTLEEGWDAVEEMALKVVIETMSFTRDPKYALLAAKTANTAIRRKASARDPRVLDASNQPTTNNVIVLNMNKTYINKQTSGNDSRAGVIDVVPQELPSQKRISDLPSPKIVENLLSPVRSQAQRLKSELEKELAAAGVVFDSDE